MVFGGILVVLGIALVLLRKVSGERGAAQQNAFFGRDVVKAKWVENWNLIFGGALTVVGISVVAFSVVR